MSQSFEEIARSPKLKITRAKRHIRDAHRQLTEYIASKPLRLVIDHDPKLSRRFIRMKTDKPMPDDIALTIGDAIHNLRSALDVVVFNMVGGKAAKPEGVQFPFAKSAESLQQTIEMRYINLAGEAVTDIIKGLRPYPGGDKFLSGLHMLDIADKHKLIVPIARFPAFTFQELYRMDPDLLDKPPPFGIPNRVALIPHGDVAYSYDAKTKMENPNGTEEPFELRSDIEPIVHITFGPGPPFEGENISNTLVQLSGMVSNIVEQLAQAFVRSQA